jgi:hypothetical protein
LGFNGIYDRIYDGNVMGKSIPSGKRTHITNWKIHPNFVAGEINELSTGPWLSIA